MRARLVFVGVVVLGASVLTAQQPTFRSGVRLVQVSVLVHDKNHQPVADLQADDFKVFEDGKEQKVEVFAVEQSSNERLSNDRGTTVERSSNDRPTVFTNLVDRSAGGVTVILFDRMNSDFDDQHPARVQIVNYLATIKATDRIALYVLEGSRVKVIHDFTTDPTRLIRAFNKYLGTAPIEPAASGEPTTEFARTGIDSLDADTEAWLAGVTESMGILTIERRARQTADALEEIADHLAGVPGRKNLVWVSAAFPLILGTGFGPGMQVYDEMKRGSRAVTSVGIAVYPVDIRGLVGPFGSGPAAATATREKRAKSASTFTTMSTTYPAGDTMHMIADQTGGRVFENSNAIGEGVRRAIEDSRISYTLGYYSPAKLDGKRHDLRVKVRRAGLDVRHRKSYLALSPQDRKDAKARADAVNRILESPIEATAIPLTAEVVDNSIVIRVDPSSLTWNTTKNVREGAIDVVIAQSTPKGEYYTVKETTLNLTADPDRYKEMLETGFTLTSGFTLQKDAYRLHVVVSDTTSQAAGSLIIPLR